MKNISDNGGMHVRVAEIATNPFIESAEGLRIYELLPVKNGDNLVNGNRPFLLSPVVVKQCDGAARSGKDCAETRPRFLRH